MLKIKSVNVLPILYKKTATGAIQCWEQEIAGNTIITHFGQVGGKIQITKDVIKSGKSIGKKNETTAKEQAWKEAEARWSKKKKAGYVEKIEDAKSDKVDAIIEGGVLPMLAKKFEDHSDDLVFPVFVQPKLDGARMLAVFDDKGKVSLWSRTRKRITSVPHLVKRLEFLGLKNTVLDGELYCHKLNKDFEKLMSAARKKDPSPESAQLEYHIYDVVLGAGFEARLKQLYDMLEMAIPPIHFVETHTAQDEETIVMLNDKFVARGYEGAMIRKPNVNYENKRSSQLLKMKSFQDEEFEIVAIEEGRGKLAGHCGAFRCKTKNGDEFSAKMAGELENLKEYFNNQDDYIGRMLTVKFQDYTGYGIPRFPVGVRIREEDL